MLKKIVKAIKIYLKLPFLKARNKYLEKKIKKVREKRKAQRYNKRPKISFIVQFFNKKQNIRKIVKGLRLAGKEEIIVIDDGSMDGSYKRWLKQLDRPNDFLLHANDLYEVRTYDRAIRMAKGEYVCLLQDDDIPPKNNVWVKQALALFRFFPKLLILGGRNGLEIKLPDRPKPREKIEYKRRGNMGSCPGVNKFVVYDKPRYKEPNLNIDFMFTMSVNRAPVFLRRKEFLKLGGIDLSYAPFQCDDAEICLRAWLLGYQVGFYKCAFKRNTGVGGMRLFNRHSVTKQDKKNWKKLYGTYTEPIKSGRLKKLVKEANRNLNN